MICAHSTEYLHTFSIARGAAGVEIGDVLRNPSQLLICRVARRAADQLARRPRPKKARCSTLSEIVPKRPPTAIARLRWPARQSTKHSREGEEASSYRLSVTYGVLLLTPVRAFRRV